MGLVTIALTACLVITLTPSCIMMSQDITQIANAQQGTCTARCSISASMYCTMSHLLLRCFGMVLMGWFISAETASVAVKPALCMMLL